MNSNKRPIKNIKKAAIFYLNGRPIHIISETLGNPTTATAVTNTKTITEKELTYEPPT